MAGAAGSAAIAARGISVVKEIVIATGLGLAAGGVFKVRPRPCAARATAAAQRRGVAPRRAHPATGVAPRWTPAARRLPLCVGERA